MSAPVSVVIPCYNAEGWVLRQVNALLPQLGDADELVLVDNRSTDGTRDVLDAVADADRRVRVVSASERAGVNHARNAGFAAASHDVILLCDADDVVRPGWVDGMRVALREPGLAGGIATPVDLDSTRLGPDIALHDVLGGPVYPLGATLGFTRDVLEAVGGFDESFIGGHDEADFAWRAARQGLPTRLAEGAHIDYLQRPSLRGTVRQRRNYARTAVLLWTRHPDLVDPHAVSLKGAALGVARLLPEGVRVLRGTAAMSEAADWGWALGLLEGHLRYRLLGSPPDPRIPAPSRRSQP